MSTATVTSKGQVTVPKDVREDLDLEAGARLSFERVSSGVYILRKQTTSVRDLAGALRFTGPPITLEEMDAALGGDR